MKVSDEDKLRKLFPNALARSEADKRISSLSVQLPFYEFTDEWVRGYIAAGGKTPFVKG